MVLVISSRVGGHAGKAGGISYRYDGGTTNNGGNIIYSKLPASNERGNKGSASSGDSSYASSSLYRNGKGGGGVKVIYLPVSVGGGKSAGSNKGSNGLSVIKGNTGGYSQGEGRGAWSGLYGINKKIGWSDGKSQGSGGSNDGLLVKSIKNSGNNGDWSGSVGNPGNNGGWSNSGAKSGGWTKNGGSSDNGVWFKDKNGVWSKSSDDSDSNGGWSNGDSGSKGDWSKDDKGGWSKSGVSDGGNDGGSVGWYKGAYSGTNGGWSGKSSSVGDWSGGSGKSSDGGSSGWYLDGGLGKSAGTNNAGWSGGKGSARSNDENDYTGLVDSFQSGKGDDSSNYGGKTGIIIISGGDGDYSKNGGTKNYGGPRKVYTKNGAQIDLSQLDLSSIFAKGAAATSGDGQQDDSDNSNDGTYSSGGKDKNQNDWNVSIGSFGNNGGKGTIVYGGKANTDDDNSDDDNNDDDNSDSDQKGNVWSIGGHNGKTASYVSDYNGGGQGKRNIGSGNVSNFKGKTVIPILISIPEASKSEDSSGWNVDSNKYTSKGSGGAKGSGNNEGLSW